MSTALAGAGRFVGGQSGPTLVKQRPGVMGDLLIFLRGKNDHATARIGAVDGVVREAVADFVEIYSAAGQAPADLGACFPVIFSNAAGKDDQVNSIKRGN
jgi:hypothetical protein